MKSPLFHALTMVSPKKSFSRSQGAPERQLPRTALGILRRLQRHRARRRGLEAVARREPDLEKRGRFSGWLGSIALEFVDVWWDFSLGI